MKIYRVDPSKAQVNTKQVLLRTIPLMLLLMLAGFYVTETVGQQESSVYSIILTLILCSIAGGAGIFIAIKKMNRGLQSYELIIDENAIIRKQHNTPNISLSREQINQIVEASNGAMVIKTKNIHESIIIPQNIMEREDLYNTLSSFSVITPAPNTSPMLYVVLTLIGCFAMFVALFVSSNPIIIITSGVLVISFLVWSLFMIQKSKIVDKQIKLFSLVSLIILGVAIIKVLSAL